MSNEKQTAMHQLIEELKRKYSLAKSVYDEAANERMSAYVAMIDKAESLLELEKQQIVEAFSQGYNSGENKALGIPEKSRKQFESSEQYYSQTYKQ